jgi:hypothetical protein
MAGDVDKERSIMRVGKVEHLGQNQKGNQDRVIAKKPTDVPR